jgi:hypothetical protein
MMSIMDKYFRQHVVEGFMSTGLTGQDLQVQGYMQGGGWMDD